MLQPLPKAQTQDSIVYDGCGLTNEVILPTTSSETSKGNETESKKESDSEPAIQRSGALHAVFIGKEGLNIDLTDSLVVNGRWQVTCHLGDLVRSEDMIKYVVDMKDKIDATNPYLLGELVLQEEHQEKEKVLRRNLYKTGISVIDITPPPPPPVPTYQIRLTSVTANKTDGRFDSMGNLRLAYRVDGGSEVVIFSDRGIREGTTANISRVISFQQSVALSLNEIDSPSRPDVMDHTITPENRTALRKRMTEGREDWTIRWIIEP